MITSFTLTAGRKPDLHPSTPKPRGSKTRGLKDQPLRAPRTLHVSARRVRLQCRRLGKSSRGLLSPRPPGSSSEQDVVQDSPAHRRRDFEVTLVYLMNVAE